MKSFGVFGFALTILAALAGCSGSDATVRDQAQGPDVAMGELTVVGGVSDSRPLAGQQASVDHQVAQAVAIESTPADGEAGAPSAPPATIDLPSDEAESGEAPNVPVPDGHAPSTHLTREPLFVNWPDPRLAIVLTGRQYGYMEPCGCSGLENQNGGLVRRSTLIKQLKERGWPVVPIDAGNQVRRFGRQAEIKFQITVEGLTSMGYRAIAFGPDDLRLPAPELASTVTPDVFVCANADIFGEPSLTSQFQVIKEGGKTLGLTAVIGERNRKMVNNSEVTMRSAEEGIKMVWPELEAARCDLYVLIAHATIEESVELAKAFPQFKLIVTTGGAGEPARVPDTVTETGAQLVQVGTKGMFAGVVALFDDPVQPMRYQRIPLDARFPDSQEMLQLLAAYQDQLRTAGFEGLGIQAQPLPHDRKFVGSEVCNDCHDTEYEIWKEGRDGHAAKHAHAYATLQHPPNSRGGIPRNDDPECIACHVVGWNPQKYFPYRSGFLSLESTPHLIDVGCENCHGPGSKHVAAENGDLDVDDDEIDELREQMWLGLDEAEKTCLECHDLDNSPAFQEEGAFERYWEKIKH